MSEPSYDDLWPWSVKQRGSGLEVGIVWAAPTSRVEMSDRELWADRVDDEDVERYRELHRPAGREYAADPPAGADYPEPGSGPVAVPADPDGPSDPHAVEVGDVVHYVARGSADGYYSPACRLAFVTEVRPGEHVDVRSHAGHIALSYDPPPTVGLAVLNPTGLFHHPADGRGVGGPLEHDPAHDEDDERVGPLCDGWHRPGTWHHPRRRPLPDVAIARAAARGTRRMERRA